MILFVLILPILLISESRAGNFLGRFSMGIAEAVESCILGPIDTIKGSDSHACFKTSIGVEPL